MPNYRYTAINAAGRKQKQTMQASSQDEVLRALADQHMVLVDIADITIKSRGKHTLKTSEKIFFTQNISVLLSSGISLGESLAIIANDTPNKASANFYEAIRVDLEQGSPLSKALAKYPDTFDSIYLSLVEAGENSGELAAVMDSLAKGLEKDARTLHQIKSAMLYPAIVLATLFVMGGAIIFFVLPKITTVFESLNAKLPLTTQLLVNFGKFVHNQPILAVGYIIVMLLLVLGTFQIKPLRKKVIQVGMNLPLIRGLIRNLDLTRLSSTLALLLGAGVPIQNALRIASGTVLNPKLSREFQAISEKLAAGTSLGQALNQTSLPRTFIALVAVGERSGKITAIFATLAEHYEELFDTSVKNFTGAIEPILTLFVGIVVGGAVITIMLPIYQFVGNLQTLTQ